MKRKLIAVLCGVMLVSSLSLMAFAASADPSVNAEVVTAEGTPYVPVAVQTVGNPNDPVGSCSETVENLPETRAVSISKNISVQIGNSWSTTFDTAKIFADDHNAFKVVVSNVSGSKYKIIVKNNTGWTYETTEYTGGSTVTVTNASGSKDYTVYVLNTGTGTLSANVKISSYYN